MLKYFLQLSHITLFSVILLACGNAGTGGGESSNPGNNGGSGNTPSIPGDGSGSGDPTAPAETIGVRIETNSENGFIERNDINKNSISIVALDHEFEEGHGTSIPSYITQRQDNDDGYLLEFNRLYVEQSNLVIKVIAGKDSQGDNIVMYAPLYSVGLNNSITVNIFSHYVVKKFFDTLETEEDLDAVIPCTTNSCANQVLAKANLLAQTNKTAQEYEITVPENLTIAASLNFLDEQIDFRVHIEAAVAEISRSVSPIAKGTRRSYGLEGSGRLQYNTEYNGLWFALSLNDLNPDNDKRDIVIATETSEIIDSESIGSNLPIYPSYNQFTSLLDARKEILSSQIPFTRSSLSVSEANNYDFELSSPSNFLATLLPNDTSASTEGFLLNARTLSQQVPDDNGKEDIGWQFNPYFSKLYKANEYERDSDASLPIVFEDEPNTSVSPTWLIGSNYSSGASYNVTRSGSTFIRGSQIEDLNIFSWELHGQETDTTFTIDQLRGKEYGVINYALNLKNGDSIDNNTTLELVAETEQWEINNGVVTLSQPPADTHFRSYIRSRERNNTVNPPQNAIISGPNSIRDIATIKTEEDSGTENRGLIQLDGAFSSKGHSTQDGKHLAFVYQRGLDRNGDERGRGITIATELSSRIPIFPELNTPEEEGDRYTLLGNSFGINAEANTLRNINNSILALSDRIQNDGTNNIDCNAELEGVSAYIEHEVGEGFGQNTLSTPVVEKTESISSTSCIQDGNGIEIKFDAISDAPTNTMFGQALTLKGFISPQGEIDDSSNIPGNVISLLWIQDDNLGLVFATKDQQLSPTFD
jgi:hypothetical protein